MHPISTAEWWLAIASFTMTAIAATGVYEALFVMPQWFADVPESLGLMRKRATIAFWIPLQILSIVSVIGGAIANWHNGALHPSLVTAVISYVLVWLSTFVFFVPGVIRFQKTDLTKPAAPNLAADGRRWLRLSWLRQAAMVVSAASLILTLAQA
jgi:hypothetical protein